MKKNIIEASLELNEYIEMSGMTTTDFLDKVEKHLSGETEYQEGINKIFELVDKHRPNETESRTFVKDMLYWLNYVKEVKKLNLLRKML